LRRAQKIRQRQHDGAFPERPKGMHHDNTYLRLWWEHREADMEQLVGMQEWLDKLEKQVG
jgi:hypothetical protein